MSKFEKRQPENPLKLTISHAVNIAKKFLNNGENLGYGKYDKEKNCYVFPVSGLHNMKRVTVAVITVSDRPAVDMPPHVVRTNKDLKKK